MRGRRSGEAEFDRRAMMRGGLAAGVGSAAVLGGAVGYRAGDHTTADIALAAVDGDASNQLGYVNVKAAPYNATGNGNTDDTAAINAANNAAQSKKWPLYFPPGNYLVSSLPSFASYQTIFGAGADLTTIISSTGNAILTLPNRQRVAIKNMAFWLTGTGGAAVVLDQCFRCSFDSVVFRGQHSAANNPQFLNAKGVLLINNTGGTSFVNCDFNNFGVGMATNAIQNYISNCKFSTNWISLLGTGNNFASGMGISNTEFTSDTNPKTTSRHILIDGRANDWWLTNLWFEGASVAVAVGNPGVGGPSQFGMVNCKLAARDIVLDLQHCRQPYLANVALDPDGGAKPLLLRINAANVPTGIAAGLISSQGGDFPLSTFPSGWTMIGNGKSYAAGPIVRSPNGKLWKLQVGNNGAVTAVATNDA